MATGVGFGKIFRSSGIVRFVQGGVVKTFRQTQINSLATENDIQRWRESANRSLEILRRRLGDLDSPKPDAQGLNMLHLAYAVLGYAHVAASDFLDGRIAFSRAVRAHCALYDLFDADPDVRCAYDRAGNFQTLLMAHATGDDEVIALFGSRFVISGVARSAGPPDSTHLATLLLSLGTRQPDSTLVHLKTSPEIDPQFTGYADCFAAIARGDVDSLTFSLESATSNWLDYATRNLSGLPQSAFFLDGVAIVQLARQHGLKPNVIQSALPLGLLDG